MLNKQGKQPRGFAGFDALVSDVEPDLRRARQAQAMEASPPSRPERATPADADQPAAACDGGPSKPSGWSVSGWWWAAGIVVLAILIFGDLGRKSVVSPAAAPTAPVPTAFEAVMPATEDGGSSVPTAPDGIGDLMVTYGGAANADEETPPIGRNLVLNSAQVRYCVAEKIRLSAMEPMIDQYADREVDGFNAFVADYNSRCSAYRYRRGVLDAAERAAAGQQAALILQARARVAAWR